MGCCESSKSIEQEIEVEYSGRDSEFFDVNLESPGDFKRLYVEEVHTTRSTCPTARIDISLLNTVLLNN